MPSPSHHMQPSVLCIDVGSRTQDALLFTAGEDPRNASRCILPAPSLLLSRRIAACTASRQDVYVHGPNMGNSFFEALLAHVQAGCRAVMHPETAVALCGETSYATEQGIPLADTCPTGHASLLTGDVDALLWRTLCRMAGLEAPDAIVVAAQDHGLYPKGDARMGRMAVWRECLHKSGGQGADPKDLIYSVAPPALTRLGAIQAVTGGPVADSGIAALLGLLAVREIAERSHRHGVLLLNAGNSHLTGFLVYKERIYGVYEQHTFGVDVERTVKDLSEFRLGWLPNEEVLQAGGHGSIFLDIPDEAEGFRPAYITGPQRHLFTGHGRMAAPFDDAMLAGCFGLLYGLGFLEAAPQ